MRIFFSFNFKENSRPIAYDANDFMDTLEIRNGTVYAPGPYLAHFWKTKVISVNNYNCTFVSKKESLSNVRNLNQMRNTCRSAMLGIGKGDSVVTILEYPKFESSETLTWICTNRSPLASGHFKIFSLKKESHSHLVRCVTTR